MTKQSNEYMVGDMVKFYSCTHNELHDALITEKFSDELANLTVFPIHAAPFDVGAVYRPDPTPVSENACWWQ